ncbi:MAG: class I SAM-dependent methyltransferase [Bacteroidota bacterium]
MTESISSTNEQQAALAFSRQSVVFDELYASDTIVHYKRERVRTHVNSLLKPNSHILELNAGTGEDAMYFAQNGHQVHATDISEGMLSRLHEKAIHNRLEQLITSEQCSFTALESLVQKGPYDHIFSNFAGLNCTDKLDHVLHSLSGLLKSGGTVTLVILPRFCLWEFLLLFKGMWRTATRRFTGKKGARSHVEGTYFTCWYYNPSFVKQQLAGEFNSIATEGLCSFVPPSYIRFFAEKHPRMFVALRKLESRFKHSWPWRSIGDYYIISFRKK